MQPELEQGTAITYRTGQALLAEFEQTGAEKAFEEIVRLYAGMVYSVCQQVTKNGHDAEDSTQATFLALATQVKLGRQVKCLGPWLRQVAKRTSLDLCKSRKRREKREENHGRFGGQDRFNGNAGEAKLESDDYKQALHDELNRLPARYRLPLVMHYFGGIPPEQAAIELNCKPKTLAVRLHRGRKMLAAQLSRRGIFIGGEMLGMASAPFMHQMLGQSLAHSTAHAAVGLTGGMDISSLISSRVMGLINTSAKAAVFAKLKFLAVILVMCSTMIAGAAQTVRKLAPQMMHLPKLNFDMTQWLKPMLRSMTSQGKVIAKADAKDLSKLSIDVSNSSFALLTSESQLQSGVSFVSYDPSGSTGIRGDVSNLTLMTPAAVASLSSVGSIQFRRGTSAVGRSGLAGESQIIDPNVSLTDADTTVINRVNAPMTPAPEPVGVATVLLSGSLLLRRRVSKPSR